MSKGDLRETAKLESDRKTDCINLGLNGDDVFSPLPVELVS